MIGRLDDKIALVAGSTSGIGAALAKALATAGARTILHGIEGDFRPPPGSHCFARDLSQTGEAAALVRAATDAVGAPDIVVHCVSIERRGPWQEIDHDAFDAHWRTNVWSALELYQAAVPAMQARGWGRLISIGSVQQVKPHPDMLGYSTSKAALDHLTRSLAHQLAPTGITANTIAPGVVATPRTAAVLGDPVSADAVRATIPMGDFATPDDITGATILLASDAGRYITGQTLFIDGLKSF